MAGIKLVDLGCGTGRMSVEFSRASAVVLSVDLDLRALKQATANLQKSGGVSYLAINARAEALPIALESVDVVFSRSTLQYVDIRSALAEIHRILRPGGFLVLNENLPGNLLVKAYRLARDVRSTIKRDRRYVDSIHQYFSHADVASLSRDFKIISVEHYHLTRPVTIYPRIMGWHSSWLTRLDSALRSFDRIMLARLPAFRRFAWIISVVAVKR